MVLLALGAFAFGSAMAPSGATAKPKKAVVVVAPVLEDISRQKVAFGDLQLATPNGKRLLTRRVGGAVKKTCYTANRSYPTESALMQCARISWKDARPQIDLAVLRAKEIAATGTSNIAAAAGITIAVPGH
jgi:UrcA family protein